MKPIIIISTYPDKKSIIKISNELVKTKLVACVNITKISSIYAWQGKIKNTSEYLAESGVLTLDWVENYLRKKTEDKKPKEVTS
jgi:hypothetical protein